MGWRFKGLYTVATRRARRWLTDDELVGGRWAHIAPTDAPDASLPRVGLLVLHGFGPAFRDVGVPWDAFWPADDAPGPSLPPELSDRFRPPAPMVAWMLGFVRETGLPIALYQCEMSGGLDDESALICDADGVTLTMRGDRGSRRWQGDRWERSRRDPLQTMLHALWAHPDRWMFPPHQRPFPNPLRPPVAVLRRRSLFAAALSGDALAVRNLLARGVEVGHPGWTVLDAAAEGGNAEAVGLLLARGDVHASPLVLGRAANPDCAHELIEAGVTFDNALAEAAGRGLDATARYLVARGAPVDFHANRHRLWFAAAGGGIGWLVDRAIADGIDLTVTDFQGCALSAAAGAGEPAMVERLLAAGAELTPTAVVAAAGHGRLVTLRTLLDRGGDPDAHDRFGTALYRAADGGHHDAVAMLLDAGAAPTATVNGGGVALAAACHSGRPDVVDLLLAAAPESVNAGNPEPLWAAVGRANQSIVDRLLAHGADPDRTTGYGLTLRGLAATRGVRV